MLPQTLPLTDFKKDYKFLWSIDGNSDNQITASGYTVDTMKPVYDNRGIKLNSYQTVKNDASTSAELNLMKQFTLDNPVYCGYISQLAEEVRLPDDEFEIEQMPNGPVTYEIPKKVKLSNIVVTYLEDSLDSVYNFHKTWFNMIRGGTGLYFNPPTKLCAVARFIEFEDTLTANEYIAFKGVVNDWVKQGLTSGLSANLTASLTSFMSSMKPEVPVGAKPTGITMYPRIYPTRISRTAANKSGTGLHKVTVTYSRIPTFKKNHTKLQKWDGATWKDVTN